MENKGLKNLVKKIPGFGSGIGGKSLIASIAYLFLFIIFLALISPSAPTILALENIGPSNKSNISLKGMTNENRPVFLFSGNREIQKVRADSEGKFYFVLNNLTDGNYTYIVKVCNSDKQKHCKSKNILVEIDQVPPKKPIIALPKELPEIEGEIVTITGKTEGESKIKAEINDEEVGEYKTDKDGNFKIETGLVLGVNTISVKAIDGAGNESEVYTSQLKYNPSKQKTKVSRVIDGDTIELENGEKVRYIGIDTPERDECYFDQAKEKNRQLVEGKEIIVEKDVSERDRYQRLLFYVWIGDTFVNEYLIKEGYAQASSYPPDIKYQDKFREVEKEAREDNRGLWGEVCNPKPSPSPEVKSTQTSNTNSSQLQIQTQQSSGYTCNCSKTCSQISSCEEA